MRKLRENRPNRVYHLISRVAHRAFFRDADERTRLADLIRRGKTYCEAPQGIGHPNPRWQKYALTDEGKRRIEMAAPL